MADRLKCSVDGGLILIERPTLMRWKALPPVGEFDPEGEFSIALDPFGLSNQVYSWPDEEWSEVWRRETQGLVSRVNDGEVALLILHEGEFWVDLDIEGDWPQAATFVEYKSLLHVSGD